MYRTLPSRLWLCRLIAEEIVNEWLKGGGRDAIFSTCGDDVIGGTILVLGGRGGVRGGSNVRVCVACCREWRSCSCCLSRGFEGGAQFMNVQAKR